MAIAGLEEVVYLMACNCAGDAKYVNGEASAVSDAKSRAASTGAVALCDSVGPRHL